MSPSTNAVRDQMIADAKSLPALLATAQTADPALFKLLTGGQTKNVWYPAVLSIVSGVAAHYALGWSGDTCSEIAGAVLLGVTGLVHWLGARLATKAPPTPPSN